MIGLNVGYSQKSNILSNSDYDNMKLNGTRKLADFESSNDYDQLLSDVNLFQSLGKSCSNDPITGRTCRYVSQSLNIITANGELSSFNFLDSSNYISFNGVNITVGSPKTILQGLFPNAYSNEKIIEDDDGQNRSALVFLIGSTDSIASLIFIFDSNNNIYKIERFNWL